MRGFAGRIIPQFRPFLTATDRIVEFGPSRVGVKNLAQPLADISGLPGRFLWYRGIERRLAARRYRHGNCKSLGWIFKVRRRARTGWKVRTNKKDLGPNECCDQNRLRHTRVC